ncbi:MAG: hypothetical protein EXS13_13820 [Planctomycetes bacterium]|nr:hypothetical protein [Planctomycetota bacterium]
MTRVEELLRMQSPTDLAELHVFWDADGRRPAPGCDVAADLAMHMQDEGVVRRRLRFLGKKLIDLLRYFLGRRLFESDIDAIRAARSFAYMSPHEVEAAVRALVKRGFLFKRVAVANEPIRFVVATELGEVLQRELTDLDLELSASFSLRRMVAARADHPSHETLPVMLEPQAVARRIAELPDDVRELFERALVPGGGLLARALLDRALLDPSAPSRRHVKESLENARLGTVRHLALGEYGINHFDETIILFEEVLSVELDRRSTLAPPPTATVRSLGVDLLSDLALLVERLTRDKVRYTQGGQIYRAAAKKIEDELILCSKGGEASSETLFNFLLDLALQRHLLRRMQDRTLQLTAKGKTWPRLSVHFKLKELLAALLDDSGRAFHPPRLRKLALERLRELKAGRWYDFQLFVGAVRQRYLAQLDDAGLREAYQSRFQYSPEAHLRDLPQLGVVVATFLVDELHLLGMVDLGLESGRPIAFCVTPLAAKSLGLAESDAPPTKSRLLVNSDFEVLLLPEADAYELIQRLDRFAERVTAQDAHRFRITPKSVERAVAGGISATEILDTLAAHSTTDLPQNLVFSVREYADKVKFVHLRPAMLLTARHREVIDALLKRPGLKRFVLERLSPRVLALHMEDAETLQALLSDEGVYLEGDPAHGDVHGNGHHSADANGHGNGHGNEVAVTPGPLPADLDRAAPPAGPGAKPAPHDGMKGDGEPRLG